MYPIQKKYSLLIGQFLFKWRGIIPVFMLIPGMMLYGLQIGLNSNQGWEITSLLFAIFGLVIRLFTVGQTPKGTSGRNTHGQLADSLNTSGIYSLTRNPLYLANTIIWLGIAAMTQNIGFLLFCTAFIGLFYYLIISAEEVFLVEKYGETYESWKRETPVFFPFKLKYQSPSRAFNWKKIIRKEKNGITAIAGVFCLFKYSAFVFSGQYDPLLFAQVFPFWCALGLAGFLYYLIIKLLMKYSNLLHN